MLGGLIGPKRWSWGAFGKHPAARDYFQVGTHSPLARAFARWVQNGFAGIPETVRRNGIYSWRFWSRGLKKGSLICGLSKSSGDGVGRPYPLMIMGEGTLSHWEKNWHLLPRALAPAWHRMEYSAVRRMADIGQLEADLARMETPAPAWKEASQATKTISGAVADAAREKAAVLQTEQKIVVPLDDAEPGGALQTAGIWHLALKNYLSAAPGTVFMGGGLERPFLAVFNRPLEAADFAALWTL
jgi:type VI secretion system protein VasJ